MRTAVLRLRCLPAVLCVALGAACTTTRIDESRVESAAVGSGEKVVVLGRRHNSEYETEPEFVRCVGRGVASTGAAVVPELEFMNSFYPWFEPRTAPMSLKRFEALLQMPAFATRMRELNLRYIVWVDGRTETVDKAGSISCAVGPGGAGCIGFGTWDDESKYEASVWDLRLSQSIATISTESAGTSYMPAVIVPVPIIARVRAAACDGLSAQLKKLFSPA
ncbi:MAG: hypothetical protein KA310_09530 [Pseudomonadales bacterium]|nr:hypothetical protein [Pseudomonadales bacterium]MBP7909153.1 hypothetical protein [Pseudomonadales bacterium]